MPISIEEYATPTFSRYRERYPIVLDKNYRYRELTCFPQHNIDRYSRNRDTDYAWKQPGYNPNDNSVTTENVNIGTDTSAQTYRPY